MICGKENSFHLKLYPGMFGKLNVRVCPTESVFVVLMEYRRRPGHGCARLSSVGPDSVHGVHSTLHLDRARRARLPSLLYSGCELSPVTLQIVSPGLCFVLKLYSGFKMFCAISFECWVLAVGRWRRKATSNPL